MAQHFMKEPCEHCPFRVDVRPFLRPERAEDIAYSAGNPYNEFFCHKTIEHDDEGDSCVTGKSLVCAGFLAMQINVGTVSEPEGWVWPRNVYAEPAEMAWAYEAEANGEWEAP